MGSALYAQPWTFKPIGLYDALDGEGAPPGAAFIMQNVVHDVSTPFIWTPRPAATAVTTFSSFTFPNAISVTIAVGTRVYGMIGSGRNPGYDEPFCYDTAANTFVAISGVTSANVPLSQPTSGPWTPPTMSVMGKYIIVAHVGFSGTGTDFFGVIDTTTLSAPAWSSSNTTSNALPSVPTCCAMFNNRTYFVCRNLLYYSDALSLAMTASSQFLTLGGSGEAITALGGLPIEQTTGGILAGLIAFKSAAYWQITGDPATNNLVLNGPLGSVGTSAARSVVQTPVGLAFMANDGIRVIDFSGTLAPAPMPGVRLPFQSAYTPSRVCAAYNNTVLRVALQTITNPLSNANGFVEYWFDYEINQWSGPHTWCSDSMVGIGTTFYVSSNRAQAALYRSDVELSSTSTFTEISQILQINLQSTLFAQDGGMSMKSVVESTINVDFAGATSSLTAQIVSDTQGIIASAIVTAINGTYWNQFNWNQANWSATVYGLRTYNIDWTSPAVYKNAAFSVSGTATAGLRIGPARIRTEELEYMNDQNPA